MVGVGGAYPFGRISALAEASQAKRNVNRARRKAPSLFVSLERLITNLLH
jgi:hypothetical protein